jgi:PIN domain nuclease of toxin-antitoxin system
VKLLLDTHAWLWWLSDAKELGEPARTAIGSLDNLVVVSAATVWEVGIKRARGKLSFDGDPVDEVARGGFEPLPISLAHAAAASALPPHHRDPFDRMLIAQAQIEGLTVITRDASFDAYEVALLSA